MKTCFMIIPGIGGHPEFHRDLISGLEQFYPVYSWPQGDFFSTPYRKLEEHQRYWAGRLESLDEEQIIIVGISFGAHIAAGLAGQSRKDILSTILVSYWPIEKAEKGALRLLEWLPSKATAWLVGQSIISFSNQTIRDKKNLQQLREKLYDNRNLVRKRLLGRLLCLRSAESLQLVLAKASTERNFIYGSKELLLRLHPSLLDTLGHSEAKLTILHGNHSISLNPNAELIAAINGIAQEIA